MKTRKINKSIHLRDVIAEHSKLIETRASNIEKRVIEGYAVIWDSKNSHHEVFNRGSFAQSINARGPESMSRFVIKFRHEHNETIGLMAELIEDEIGLYFRTHPLDEGDLEDEVLKKLKSGVFNNFSIGFNYVRGKYNYDEETDTLYIFEANLFEISVVGIPSDQATYAIRSNEGGLEKLSSETETFILSLPKQKQLEARQMFATYQSLIENEQESQDSETLINDKQNEHS